MRRLVSRLFLEEVFRAVGGGWTALSANKDSLQALQSIVATIAIVTAGLWFFYRGELRPRIHIEHLISTGPMKENFSNWVRAEISVTNYGSKRVTLSKHRHTLRDIYPVPDALFDSKGDLLYTSQSRFDWPSNPALHFRWDSDRYDEVPVSRRLFENSRIRLEPGETHIIYLDYAVAANSVRMEIETIITNPNEPEFVWLKVSQFCIPEQSGGEQAWRKSGCSKEPSSLDAS